MPASAHARTASLSRPRPVAMDADESLTLLRNKLQLPREGKVSQLASFVTALSSVSAAIYLLPCSFSAKREPRPPILRSPRLPSKMGCVNCKPSRSSLYAVEKEKNKSSKRKNKKSLSSLIRKLFGKKNRRSNNPTIKG